MSGIVVMVRMLTVEPDRRGPTWWLTDIRGRKWVRLPYLAHEDRIGRWWPLAANG